MNERTHGDVGKRQAVARFDVRRFARNYRVALLKPERCENISLFAVGIVQKRYERGAVGIVFYRGNFRGDAVLVALEVDNAVLLTVAAADMTDGDLAREVAAAVTRLFFQKRLIRLVAR